MQMVSQNLGWSCPVCGYCYSPTTTDCSKCNRPDSEKYVTTTSSIGTTAQICLCTKNGPGYVPGTYCGVCGGLIANFTVTA